MILLVAAGPETDVALFQLLVADDDARLDARPGDREVVAFGRHGSERGLDDVAHLLVLNVADGRNDDVRRAVDVGEITA